MKIGGNKVTGPIPEKIIIPRGTENIVFTAVAVLDYNEFDKLCPVPEAPKLTLRGGAVKEDKEDKKYQDRMLEYATRRVAWMILTSLRATEGLEWETVDYNNPDTWEKYSTELSESFSQMEINLIIQGVMVANAMSDERLNEARTRFFQGQDQQPVK